MFLTYNPIPTHVCYSLIRHRVAKDLLMKKEWIYCFWSTCFLLLCRIDDSKCFTYFLSSFMILEIPKEYEVMNVCWVSGRGKRKGGGGKFTLRAKFFHFHICFILQRAFDSASNLFSVWTQSCCNYNTLQTSIARLEHGVPGMYLEILLPVLQ